MSRPIRRGLVELTPLEIQTLRDSLTYSESEEEKSRHLNIKLSVWLSRCKQVTKKIKTLDLVGWGLLNGYSCLDGETWY